MTNAWSNRRRRIPRPQECQPPPPPPPPPPLPVPPDTDVVVDCQFTASPPDQSHREFIFNGSATWDGPSESWVVVAAGDPGQWRLSVQLVRPGGTCVAVLVPLDVDPPESWSCEAPGDELTIGQIFTFSPWLGTHEADGHLDVFLFSANGG